MVEDWMAVSSLDSESVSTQSLCSFYPIQLPLVPGTTEKQDGASARQAHCLIEKIRHTHMRSNNTRQYLRAQGIALKLVYIQLGWSAD